MKSNTNETSKNLENNNPINIPPKSKKKETFDSETCENSNSENVNIIKKKTI